MTDTPELPRSSVLAFKEAVDGVRGDLDAWLEVNNEAEVRAHVRAYAAEAVRVARQADAAQPVAWMAESSSGTVRFTNIGQSADELQSMGWSITPLYATPPQADQA